MRPVKSSETESVKLADGEILVVLTAQDIENITAGLTRRAADIGDVYRYGHGGCSMARVAQYLAQAAEMGVLANEFYSANFSPTEA